MKRLMLPTFLLASALAGWGLAMARLGERSFWADEGFTAVVARGVSLIGLLKTLKLDPNQGALHLLLVTGAMKLGGSEFVLRFPSAMAALLVLPLMYLLGRHLMSREAALAGVFLHAISPYIVGYAQEARPYALLEFLACLSLVLLLEALAHDRWYWWAALSVTLSLLLYTHHFGWFVVGSEFLFATGVLVCAPRAARRRDRRITRLLGSFSAGLALYLPWLPVLLAFWRQSGPGGSPIQAAGLPRFALSLKFFRDMLAVFGSRSYGWQVYLFAGSILGGIISLAFRRRWQVLWLVALWFVVPLAALSAFATAHFFDFRYVIFFVPVLLLLAGEGLAACVRLVCRLLPRLVERQWAPLLSGGLTILLFLPANFPALRTQYHWEKENWRPISAFIRENLQPSDAIYVSPRYWANPMLYYEPSLVQRLLGGSAEDVDQVAAAANRQLGLWFLRYAGALGDPTGRIGPWLDEHGFVLLIDGRGCGSGIYVYYGRTGDGAESRKAELRKKAATLCSEDLDFRRQP